MKDGLKMRVMWRTKLFAAIKLTGFASVLTANRESILEYLQPYYLTSTFKGNGPQHEIIKLRVA